MQCEQRSKKGEGGSLQQRNKRSEGDLKKVPFLVEGENNPPQQVERSNLRKESYGETELRKEKERVYF